MEIRLSDEQRAFRDELRAYFAEMMTDELRRELATPEWQEGGGPEFRKAMRQMGRDGLLGLSWPREYGGQERTPVEQFLFADEIQATGFPLPFLTLNTVGPVLFQHGSEEQRREICSKILAGELFISIGYSEPGAGTDLASLKTSARRDGDEWLINGQKMWTSLAQYADYIWLAARTDPSAQKHRGLSMFLVPTSAEGFARQEIRTVGGVRTNATFYDDVRVPAGNLIGKENGGWKIITGQLNHERISLLTVGRVQRLLEDATAWARESEIDGRRVSDLPWVQHNLARVHAKVSVLRLMNWQQAWAMTKAQPNMADSSAIKVFGSEATVECSRLLMEVLGARGILAKGSPGAALRGQAESSYRNALILTFGAGTNEVQRDIIAMAGMGLPHYKE
jgi:acyl-CoA dehydrogenase